MPCLGALLVQPQRLQRPDGVSSLDDLANDVLRLISRLATDVAREGRLLRVIGEAFEGSASRVYTNARAGLGRAEQRLQDWFGPLLDGARGLGAQLPDGIEGGAELVQRFLERLATLAGAFDADALRPHAERLVDILENDLGVSPRFVTDQIWALVDDLIDRLGTLPPDLDDDTRATWIEMRAVLRRLKRRLQPEFSFPGLSVDLIVAGLLKLLRRSPIPFIAARAACLGRELAKGVHGAGQLVRLVPPTGFGAGSLGAAAPATTVEAQYCWYATWLFEIKKRPEWWEFWKVFKDRPWYLFWKGFPDWWRTDEVWVEKDRTQVRWGEHVLLRGTDLTWEKALEYRQNEPRRIRKCADRVEPCAAGVDDEVIHAFYGYTFGETLTPAVMEGITRHSAWIRDYSVAVLHLLPGFSLREGDVWANIANAVALAGEGTFKLATRAPLSWWMDHVGGPMPGWARGVLGKTPWSVVATVLGSLEGRHTNVVWWNWLSFQLTQTLSDAIKTLQYRSIVDTLRDGMLSFLTLLNYEGIRALEAPVSSPTFPFWKTELVDDRPDNRKEIDGVADLGVLLFTYLLIEAIPRDQYSHPFADGENGARHWVLYLLLAGAGMGLVGGLAGCFVAEFIAWAEDWRLLGKKMLQSVWQVWKGYWLALYDFMEGDTDDGRYNPRGPAYQGYPDNETSPYRLPWAAGAARVCGQGNQGMWSHNNFANTSEVYAYDFGLDGAEQVLAARPGTIVDFFDSVPDDTNPANPVGAPAGVGLSPNQTQASRNNFIIIRHDLDEAGNLVIANPPRGDHDRGARGAPVWTYGVYLHGRTGSVRATFAGAAPTAILGQAVVRGQPIMLAGDTGLSFHNHLHMHVLTGPAPQPQNTYFGNGTQTVFAYTFLIVNNPQLTVSVNGVVLILNVDYTVTGAGNPNGGNVTFTIAPAAGATIVLLRTVFLPVARANLVANSIPFVFCEVTNPSPFDPDGVCLARTYYTSANDGRPC